MKLKVGVSCTYRFVRIPMAIKITCINYKLITYVYNSIWTWDLHHHVPHELVILFIYSFALYLLINPARRLFNLVKCQKYPFLTKINKCSLQELYGKVNNIFGILT